MTRCDDCGKWLDTDAVALDKCTLCNGTGEVDSGGFDPQGHGINIPCQCQAMDSVPMDEGTLCQECFTEWYPECQECGEKLTSWDEFHPYERCVEYKAINAT